MVDVSPDTVAAWVRLMSASRVLLARVETALKAAGLPPLTWYDALLEIERAGEAGIRPFALQERLLLPQYGASRLLERIEAAGLIARTAFAGDRRGHVLRITAAGRATRRAMWPVYGGALAASIETRLDREDRGVLTGLLEKLTDAEPRPAGASGASAPPAPQGG